MVELPNEYRVVHVADTGERRACELADVDDLGPGWFWLDVVGPTADVANDLARRFELDRVTRDDIIEPQFPKFEDLEDHLVIVVHALAADAEVVRTVEIDVLVADRWIVTVHAEPLRSIDHLQGRLLRPSFAADDPFHLACRLVELVGERYLPILDEIDIQVLDLEDDAVEGDPSVLPDIHALRRDIAVLRRILAPQRRMVELLSRRRPHALHDGVSERASRDLADAVDHHVRLIESLDAAHQMVATLVDTYRGAAAEQMNEVMKVLTVFSAIFMPLTLIAGIYGMNFERMPELDEPWGYGTALGAMAILGTGLWVYFVRRGFIGGPRLQDLARPAKAAGRVGRGLASAATLPIRAATRTGSGPAPGDGRPGGDR